VTIQRSVQPYFKLHGSSNWKDESGEPVLIMGSAKSGAIERFPVLKAYHDSFRAMSSQAGSKLMVIGYSFQDEHINQVICDASTKN
jgi:SIR2-like domain